MSTEIMITTGLFSLPTRFTPEKHTSTAHRHGEQNISHYRCVGNHSITTGGILIGEPVLRS